MNFYNIIQNILDTSSKHKNVKEVSEGDIYVYLNSGEHKYPCVFLTVGEVTDSEMSRNVNCTLFYVDRLSSDQSNRTVVQSLGITTLGDILDTIEGDVVSVNYTTFTEKFADMCAGVFATVDITYPLDEVCDEHFEVRQLEITENGIYNTIGYDEFVIEVVNEELVERVEELTANIEQKEQEVEELTANIEQKEQEVEELTANIEQKQQEVEELTANIEQKEVEISQLENEVSIKEEQINSVTSISITKNGTYTPPTNVLGYNIIEANIESSGPLKVLDGMMFGYSSTLPESLDTSGVTNFAQMFRECRNITTVPQLDTSKGTDFGSMFYGCSKLTTIPQLEFDTSNGTKFSDMFYSCMSLTAIPQLDTSKCTNFAQMFYYCSKLTSIPQLDTSKGTKFYQMFYECGGLTTIPQLDTSNGTDFSDMFSYCDNLTTIPPLDTANGTNFNKMFYYCSKLTTIPPLDTSKGTSFTNMFYRCSKLENIIFVGSINANVDFSACTLLTYDSVKSILTACSNTTKTTTSKTLTLKVTHTDVDGELAALVATCNTKGWTISGLTLN